MNVNTNALASNTVIMMDWTVLKLVVPRSVTQLMCSCKWLGVCMSFGPSSNTINPVFLGLLDAANRVAAILTSGYTLWSKTLAKMANDY